MFVRKTSAKLGVVGLAASAVAFAALSPAGAATTLNTNLNQGAAASSTPAASSDAAKGSIVFAGSDTIQYVVADLADAWNGSTGAGQKIGDKTYNMLSYNALANDGGAVANLTGWNGVNGDTSANITTPNGSGGGLKLLGATDANGGSVISFARSSSAPDATDKLAAGKTSDATGYPFAVDTVVLAVSAKNTAAPKTLTDAQALSIYNGTDDNWSQVGGGNAPIHPLVPKSGSGTAKFFGSSIDSIAVAAGGAKLSDGNGGLKDAKNTYLPAGATTEVNVPEHSGAPLAADSDAIVPISLGRAILWNKTNPSSQIRILGGFREQRALWLFARTSDTTAAANGQTAYDKGTLAGGAVTKAILGNGDGSGFFCSPAAQEIIKADGFFPLTAKYCGAPKTTTGDIISANATGDHIAPADMVVANPLLTVDTPSTGTTTPPATTGDPAALKTAKLKLAHDKKQLTQAKKALKKAKGHKKAGLKKKVAKLQKAIKADQKKIASLS